MKEKGELIFQGEVHTPVHLWGQLSNQKYFKIPSKTNDEKSFFAFCLNQRLVLTGRLNGTDLADFQKFISQNWVLH